MAFPETPLPIRAELDLGDRWEDITPYWDEHSRIVITRGQRGEAATVDPTTCTLTLRNADGRFSPRNPVGPYYGRIGRNTPLRVSVGAGPSRLELTGDPAGHASTPHVPALDVGTALDVRIEVTADWRPSNSCMLIGKWTTGDRSWMLGLTNTGSLRVYWYGTAGIWWFSSRPLPSDLPERAAFRATIEVNTVASTATTRLYWAPTMDGPWTQLGADGNFTNVTTPIRAGGAPVRISGDDPTADIAWQPLVGQVHRAEVRAGADGPIVASPDFRGLHLGTTNFTDSAGRAWAVTTPAQVANWQTRFIGEVSTWPTKWGPSGYDAEAQITASGILRRLSQGQKALDSTLRRRIPSFSPIAYWPMEEDRDATQAYSPIAGVRPMKITDIQMGSDDSLPGSSALPTLGAAAAFSGTVPGAPAGEWHVEFVYRLDELPSTVQWLVDVHTTGAMRVLHVALLSDRIQLIGEDEDGKTHLIIEGGVADLVGSWARFRIFATTSGSNTSIRMGWIQIGGIGRTFDPHFYAGSPGRVTRVAKPGENGSSLQGMALGHVAVFATAGTTAFNRADHGFTGETASARITRLCAEEGVPVLVDAPEGSAAMGPQRPGTLLELLQECADADGGLLAEDPERIGLIYRARTTVYNQPVALPLRYGQGREVQPPLEPVDDDLAVRNDVTVSRPGGSSAHAVQADGPLSVQPPPAGVGRYDESTTLNLANDDQLPSHAGWRLHLGTVDEPRYPTVNLDLARASHLIPAVMGLRLRDRLTITGTPPQWAPGPIDQLVQGWTETLGVRTWGMQLACAPASPWTVGIVGDAVLGRVDTSGSVLASAATATATVLEVRATAGHPWTTDPADHPLDLEVGGETVTVSSTTHAAQDTYTRTVTTGWGTADSGQTWTTTGGSSSDYYVQGA
ncbi:hypothetical protein [Streptomyces macrosporus]|uniref:Minor tail protein n=1 Tax=Streptomyces macrosporus TaxID=44032 RepID=A0ABN3KDY5_9ACTN